MIVFAIVYSISFEWEVASERVPEFLKKKIIFNNQTLFDSIKLTLKKNSSKMETENLISMTFFQVVS